ncbi:MAG TPA: AtpZ/AtpI family protein [Candidatus Peribacterales bacterium]|nr:AtpZ/AtpI family protein [Candidatus Peribacterales bacterium]
MAAILPAQAPKKQEPLNAFQMLGLVGEIGTMIAIPAVLFGFGGAYLDKSFGTSPLFVILGLAIALIASSLAVWHRIQTLLVAS